MNIIGDVAGRIHELRALLKKMPTDNLLFVGDLNDRGRHSNEVIEFVMAHPGAKCLKSNHGCMMIALYNRINHTNYPCGNYRIEDLLSDRNGCIETARSYGGMQNVPKEHIEWMVNLPWYYEDNEIFVSHAPWHYRLTLQEACDLEHSESLLWNRNLTPGPSKKIPHITLPLHKRDKFQIYGHNGNFKEHRDEDGKLYGMCIDDSRHLNLMGVHWPSLQVYEQEFLTWK